MKLCIAEKPSVAKELAEILGAKSRHDGYYEGNGYWVSWTFGHLCTLKMPEDYHPDLKRWSLFTLPIIPQRFQIKVVDDTGIQKQFNTIKRLVGECDEVINCGDAGQEGELIQRWVLSLAQNTKPLKRLWISSLTAEAIREGFNKLQEGSKYDLLFHAGHARAISDWLLGINATRLYTTKYSNGKGVLSIGRVQTPTLALIVRRHLEIVNFTPEAYWELKTLYRGVIFSATQGRFAAADEAADILEKIRESLFTITSFEKKKGTEAPPRLFDLTSLQVECNKKFAFTAEETLGYIQSLYEKKQVSYPRVDTTFLPDDVYPKIPGILKGLKPYETFTEPLLKSKIKKSKKVFDDSKVTDHHAIIPTGEFNPNLTYNEKKVFDLIIRRFIAAFYPDCIVSNTTVLGEAAEIPFKATGKQILEDGWRILFKKKDDDKENDDENPADKDDQLMPEFVKGESGPHEPGVQEKFTQPPKPYTEATLLRAMETAGKQVDDEELRDALKENGIGRPSTRANIIETLFKRKYIRRVRKNLEPTVTGIELIQTINNEQLKSVELTGIWERKLRQIEKGDYQATDFLAEMKEMVKALVVEVITEREVHSITIEEEPAAKEAEGESDGKKTKAKREKKPKDDKPAEFICPKCKKGKVLQGKTAYGCSEYKNGCGFRLSFEQFGKKLTDKQVESLIANGKTSKIKGFTLDGTKCEGILTLNANGEVELQRDEAPAKEKNAKRIDELTCPTCGQGKILQGKTAFGCSRWKEGCNFKVSFDEISAKHPGKEVNLTLLDEYLKGNSK